MQSVSLLHSATWNGDTVGAGVVRGREAGIVVVPAGSGEGVIQPATDITAKHMTRSMITFMSI
jgi:hypothetical protein